MSDIEPSDQFLVYRDGDGTARNDVHFAGDTVWLTQAQLSDLFDISQQNISLRIQNVYEEGELTREATHKDFLTVRREGSREIQRSLTHYNLDIVNLDGFLTLTDREILTSAGKVSHELAAAQAATEFQRFKQQQPAEVESNCHRLAKQIIEEHKQDE